jgi:hypothetical protein
MKTVLLTLLVFVSSIAAFAQGTVYFSNLHYSDSNPAIKDVDAPFFDSFGNNKLSGPAFTAELVAGPSAIQLKTVSRTVFLTDAKAGYFDGGVVAIPNISPGATAFLQVRAFATSYGSFAAAQASGFGETWGQTPIFQVITGGTGTPPTPAAALLGLNSIAMNWGAPPPTAVTIPSVSPTNESVALGSQVLLTISAFGTPPLSYQWFFGSNSIPGATKSWLVLSNAQSSQSGVYTVVVTNSTSSATSPPMTLNVLPAMVFHLVPAIDVQGDLGSTYRIDYVNSVGPTNSWTPLATVTVTNRPQYYVDLSAIGQPARLYRLVQVP